MSRILVEILRISNVCKVSGVSRATIYRWIDDGLMTRPVRFYSRLVGIPNYEVEAIIQARIQGKSDQQVRELVARLEAERGAHCGPCSD